jgi:hypothetical protein
MSNVRVKANLRFKIGLARAEDRGDIYGDPFVLPGSIVEVVAYPGQRLEVNGKEYEIPFGSLALRVIEGQLSNRREVRGKEAVGFTFYQSVTGASLAPMSLEAAKLKRRIIAEIAGVKHA